MRQFNPPPGWPEPPNARWRPPKNFTPDRSWPSPPAGWAFWVDQDGQPVRGPIGRYGGPPVVKISALVATVLALAGLLLFVPFGGRETATTTSPPPPPTESQDTTSNEGTTTRPPVGKPFGSSPDEVTTTPNQQNRSQEPSRSGSRTSDPVTEWFPEAQGSASPTAPAPPWTAPAAPASSTQPATPRPSPSKPTTAPPSPPASTTPAPSPSPTATVEPTQPAPSPTQPSTPEQPTPSPIPSPTPTAPSPSPTPSPTPTRSKGPRLLPIPIPPGLTQLSPIG
ncbi:hypothetical protein ACWCOV_28440 [Kribbella sp. NPDC002412]